MPTKLSWISIYLASAYDDIIVSTDITIRDFVSKYLNISHTEMYYSSIMFSLGILTGSIVWNIIARCISVKKTMLMCQTLMLFSIGVFLCSDNLFFVLFLRFSQGFFAIGSFICLNILIKNTLSQNKFNKFLALNALFTSVSEGVVPLINGFLNEKYGFKACIAFLILLSIIIMFSWFTEIQDKNDRQSLNTSIKETYFSYANIINSKLLIILIAIGITEGLDNLMFNVLEVIINNSFIDNPSVYRSLPITMSSICILSSLCVNFVFYFLKDTEVESKEKFNWNSLRVNDDRKILFSIIGFLTVLMLLANFINTNSYYVIVCYTALIVSGVCIINYILAKTVYLVYSNSGSVASAIILSEKSISALIQYKSSFILEIKNNKMIFLYIILYLGLTYLLIRLFYTLLDRQFSKQTSNKKLDSVSL